MQQNSSQNQLGLGLPQTKKENWLKIKKQIENIEKNFEITPFWKYGLNIFTLVTIILYAGIVGYFAMQYYPTLPEQIPLVFNQSSDIWEMYPKYVFLIISLMFFLGQLGLFILSYHIYFFDKRLSIIINLLSIVMVYLLLLGSAQILSFELL